MDKKVFDKDKLIKYWIDDSEDYYDTMIIMYKSKRYYWALFVRHLMLEKLLKAYFVKSKSDYPPLIHNLLRLAEKSEIELNDKRKEELITVTAFNINARYNDYKTSFKLKCTPEYTAEWIEKMEELRKWIKRLIL